MSFTIEKSHGQSSQADKKKKGKHNLGQLYSQTQLGGNFSKAEGQIRHIPWRKKDAQSHYHYQK